MLDSLRCALAFLTRLPVGEANFDGRDVGRSTAYFPVVGVLLALLELAVLALALPRLGAMAAAVLACAAMARLTGAFHLDAIADMADGFGGGLTRERVLEIMRDHVIGAYGAVTLVLALGLRVAALAGLAGAGLGILGAWLIAAGAWSRCASAWMGWALPYARASGQHGQKRLGAAVTDHVGRREVVVATSLAAALSLAAFACSLDAWVLPLALTLGVSLVTVTAMARLCLRRIGGVTGDTLGATTQAVELAVLTLGLALT